MLKALFFLTVVLIVVGLVVGGLYLPYRGFTNEVFLDFPKGTSTRQMGEQLAKAGVIRYPWQFQLLRVTRPGATLQAGEYRFHEPDSARHVFDRIARGDV